MSTETNPTPAPAASGIDGKTIAIISYFSWVGWIIAFVLYNSNKSQLAAYHIRQTLLLHIIAIVIGISRFMFLFGWFFLWLSWVLYIALFVLWLIGLISAINGEEKPMPILGKTAQQMFASIK